MECNAIIVSKTGGPEVLKLGRWTLPEPGTGEVLMRNRAVGVNFGETYSRSGAYEAAKLPYVPGGESAGVVEAIGPGVKEFKVGDRVACGYGHDGSYAEARIVPERFLVKIPEGVDDLTAAAALSKGMTVHYLLHTTYPVKRGETILVHAAAGGVGLLMVQWASHLGATVIGTVSTDEKARQVAANGCAYPIVYTREDFLERVREITHGEMLPVVYDSVGKDTFWKSLDCLRPRGYMVCVGQSSGLVPPFDLFTLRTKGSLYLTRPTLRTHVAKREDLVERANAVFDALKRGVIRCEVKHNFPLAEAAEAHRALEERRTTGSCVLVP